jgi:hypothetical protein
MVYLKSGGIPAYLHLVRDGGCIQSFLGKEVGMSKCDHGKGP